MLIAQRLCLRLYSAGIDLSQDGHKPVTFHQLTHWGDCASWKGFKVGPSQILISSFCFIRIQTHTHTLWGLPMRKKKR